MNRKEFVKSVSLMGAASMVLPKYSFAAVKGSDKIKVAIVGMGNRGRAALMNMFDADNNVELVAVGDAYSYPIESGKKVLEHEIKKRKADFKDYWKVGDNAFVGLDAIDKVVKTDADIVVLTTPPIFRPEHIRKCLENNKNIFAEKPICIDATQLRQVYSQLIPLADQKKLNVVCGTQMRYQEAIAEAVKRVQDGQIGDVISGQFIRYETKYLMNSVWRGHVEASLQPDDVDFQLKNWLGFVWPSGGQFVEQYIHNLDMALWVFGGLPDEVIGSGGRQNDLPFPLMGNRYSNIHAQYDYADGKTLTAACRQENGATDYAPFKVYGTKGILNMSFGRQVITGDKPCVIDTPKKHALVCEHKALIDALRSGNHINTMKTCADSCYIAIAGREAAASGKRFKCRWILERSKQNLMPQKLELGGKLPIAPVPSPSTYKLV